MNRQTLVEARCVAVADILVPNYRNGSRAYSCAGHVAKMWQAAYDGAAAVLADPVPADVRRLVIAAREVTDCGTDEDETRELFDAVEAFSSRVPYEDEPDDMADASVPDRLARRMGAEFVTRDAAPPVEGLTSGEGDRYADGYAQGLADADRQHQWMQDKAWQDAVLMLVHYQTLAERTWLVGHEEAAAKLAEWWKRAKALAETKSVEDIAASPKATATDDRRTIEILRRALAWHGDRQRMATTREEWQQTIDEAIVWVMENPEPGVPSFSTWAGREATATASVREDQA